MATGDNAAARGMQLVSGSSPANTLDTEDNLTRDYIDLFTRWGALLGKPSTFPNDDVTAATFGGDNPANGGKLVRFSPGGFLGHPTPTSAAHTATKGYVDSAGAAGASEGLMRRNSSGQTAVATPTTGGHAANKSYVDGNDDAILAIAGQAIDGLLDDVVYTRTLGGSYRNLYVSSNGTLGWVASSERFKKNIKDWTPDRQAILAMQLVQFQYKVTVDTERTGTIEHGLIAEQLHDLGLEWLVDYGTDGLPEGVRYDRISLALLSVVQDHEDRLTRLEQGA